MLREELARLLDVEGAPDAGDALDVLWIARLGGLDPVDWSLLGDGTNPTAVPPPADPPPPAPQDDHPVPDRDPDIPTARFHLPDGTDSNAPARPGGARTVRVAQPQALPEALVLTRALRPLRQTVPSTRARTLDIDATAAASGDSGLLLPVLRPAAERRFSVDLLIDTGTTMTVWHRLAGELRALLTRHGAFADVRTWALRTDGPEPGLAPFRLGARAVSPAHRWRQALADPAGRRTVLLLTDGVGPAWYGRELPDALADWSRDRPVAVLQVLPSRLWHRTALRAASVRARGTEAGRATLEVRSSGPLPGIARGRAGAADRARISWLPVLEVSGEWLGPWARLVAGRTTDWVPLRAAPLTVAERPGPANPADEPSTPAAWIEHFEEGYSPEAFRLLRLLAAAPLSLPVMRLVQRTMLPSSTPMHLAEIFLSGLLVRRTPMEPGEDPDSVLYDFRDGVREALLARLTRTESQRVLDRVIDGVSERVAATLGGVTDFRALVVTAVEGGGGLDGLELPEGSRAFAEVALAVIGGVGGDYAEEVAAKLARGRVRDEDAAVAVADRELEEGEELRRSRRPWVSSWVESLTERAARALARRLVGTAMKIPEVEGLMDEQPAGADHDMETVAIRLRARAPRRLPRLPTPFIGRDTSHVVEVLLRGRPSNGKYPIRGTSTCVIEGAPGTGKTVLAIQCAGQLATRFTMVRWLRAHSWQTLLQDLTSLAEDLGLDPAEVPAGGLRAYLKEHPGWLLIYDGVTPETFRLHVQDDVPPDVWRLPPKGYGSVLVTFSEAASWPGGQVERLVLDDFGPDEARSYLKQALADHRGELWDREVELDDLVDVAGTNPLVLSQLVRSLAAGRKPVDRHVQQALMRRPEVERFLPSLVWITGGDTFLGTGVVVGPNEVLTAAPIVSDRAPTAVVHWQGGQEGVFRYYDRPDVPGLRLLELRGSVLPTAASVAEPDSRATVATWLAAEEQGARPRLRPLSGGPRPLPLGTALIDARGSLCSLIESSASGTTAHHVTRELLDSLRTRSAKRRPAEQDRDREFTSSRPPLNPPRRLLVWPAPDFSTAQALRDRGYRPRVVRSPREAQAEIAASPAALLVDSLNLTGPVFTWSALQSLRQAALAAEVPVLVTTGFGQAPRQTTYGADPGTLMRALAPADRRKRPPHVLLVEGRTEIALALTAALERHGTQVGRAASDADAAIVVEGFRPDVVVMNLMQVHRRGDGVVDRLRVNGQLNRTPLVVYTAAVDAVDLPRLESGEDVLFFAERSTSAEVQSRIVDLLEQVSAN
ncbi:hypothetical protein GCM10022232_08340 [Streptomyces plumbiresistens]|uniref:Response regulatory domain-containing protein n=1 Tax=Streptomyces plumbiresistens TaxID=511811 RepID=A0ABP7Q9F3_9ACTN